MTKEKAEKFIAELNELCKKHDIDIKVYYTNKRVTLVDSYIPTTIVGMIHEEFVIK